MWDAQSVFKKWIFFNSQTFKQKNFQLKMHLKVEQENSLVVQWLGLCIFTDEDLGLIPGWGTKIPQAVWNNQKKKKKVEQYKDLLIFRIFEKIIQCWLGILCKIYDNLFILVPELPLL